MRERLRAKLHSSLGINRLVAVLLAAALVLAVLLAVPGYRAYQKIADRYGCTVALKKAQDMLDVEFLGNYALSLEEAETVVERAKWEQEALCPAGGDYYLVDRPESDQAFRVTCGLHERDTRLRTRLNGYHAYELLLEELLQLERRGLEPPEDGLTLTLNSRPLLLQRLEGDNGLRWGTKATIDHEGTVCFFALAADGSLRWFCYADEDHAAVWSVREGWIGDAYITG